MIRKPDLLLAVWTRPHWPCCCTVWRSEGSRQARWRWCPSAECVCSASGRVRPEQPAEASGCWVAARRQGGSSVCELSSCWRSYTPAQRSSCQTGALKPPFSSTGWSVRADLVTVLAEVVPVGFNNWQRELRHVIDAHLWVTLGQMINLRAGRMKSETSGVSGPTCLRASGCSPASLGGGNPSCKLCIWTWSSRSRSWEPSVCGFWSAGSDPPSWPLGQDCACVACAPAAYLSSTSYRKNKN